MYVGELNIYIVSNFRLSWIYFFPRIYSYSNILHTRTSDTLNCHLSTYILMHLFWKRTKSNSSSYSYIIRESILSNHRNKYVFNLNRKIKFETYINTHIYTHMHVHSHRHKDTCIFVWWYFLCMHRKRKEISFKECFGWDWLGWIKYIIFFLVLYPEIINYFFILLLTGLL